MPIVQYPLVLKTVYERTLALIERHQTLVPTELIAAQRTVYRSVDQDYITLTTDGSLDPRYLDQQLLIRDQESDSNRFSGQSLNETIPSYGGLYCSTQQQAQVAELSFYARIQGVNPSMVKDAAKSGTWLTAMPMPRDAKGFPKTSAVLNRKCILRIRLTAPVLVADVSDHNPGAAKFLASIAGDVEVQHALRLAKRAERPFVEYLSDSTDCSAARGIGLAVAASKPFQGLQATTARVSERSPEEKGDNVVFYGRNGQKPSGMKVDQAWLFPLHGAPRVYSF